MRQERRRKMNKNGNRPNNAISWIFRIAAYLCYALAIVFFLMRGAGSNLGGLPIWMIVAGAALSFVSAFVNLKHKNNADNDDNPDNKNE